MKTVNSSEHHDICKKLWEIYGGEEVIVDYEVEDLIGVMRPDKEYKWDWIRIHPRLGELIECAEVMNGNYYFPTLYGCTPYWDSDQVFEAFDEIVRRQQAWAVFSAQNELVDLVKENGLASCCIAHAVSGGITLLGDSSITVDIEEADDDALYLRYITVTIDGEEKRYTGRRLY